MHIKIRYRRALMHVLPEFPIWTSDIGGYHFHWQAPTGQRQLIVNYLPAGSSSEHSVPSSGYMEKVKEHLFSDNWDAPTKSILLKYDNLRYRLLALHLFTFMESYQ